MLPRYMNRTKVKLVEKTYTCEELEQKTQETIDALSNDSGILDFRVISISIASGRIREKVSLGYIESQVWYAMITYHCQEEVTGE